MLVFANLRSRMGSYLQRIPTSQHSAVAVCITKFPPTAKTTGIRRCHLSPGSTLPPSAARGKKRPAEQLGLPEKRCIHHGEAAF